MLILHAFPRIKTKSSHRRQTPKANYHFRSSAYRYSLTYLESTDEYKRSTKVTITTMPNPPTTAAIRNYNLFLLLVAGLGGLLYGVDVGIIGGAIPYLQATSHLTPGQLSAIVAAVLLGSVISTLFAGLIADWIGRKPFMILCGLCFIVSIPVIARDPP